MLCSYALFFVPSIDDGYLSNGDGFFCLHFFLFAKCSQSLFWISFNFEMKIILESTQVIPNENFIATTNWNAEDNQKHRYVKW